jgi:hypothetical protein
MEELADLMREVLSKLTDISIALDDISRKLDDVSGIYGIDAVVSKLDEVADNIRGPLGYSLTDLFTEVSDLNSKTS